MTPWKTLEPGFWKDLGKEETDSNLDQTKGWEIIKSFMMKRVETKVLLRYRKFFFKCIPLRA